MLCLSTDASFTKLPKQFLQIPQLSQNDSNNWLEKSLKNVANLFDLTEYKFDTDTDWIQVCLERPLHVADNFLSVNNLLPINIQP